MDKNLHVCGFKYLWRSITNWNSLINRELSKSEKFRRFRLENVQALTRFCCYTVNQYPGPQGARWGGWRWRWGLSFLTLKAVFCRSPRDAAAPLSPRRAAGMLNLHRLSILQGKLGSNQKSETPNDPRGAPSLHSPGADPFSNP